MPITIVLYVLVRRYFLSWSHVLSLSIMSPFAYTLKCRFSLSPWLLMSRRRTVADSKKLVI